MQVLTLDTETSRHCGNLPWYTSSFLVSLCVKFGSEMRTFVFNHKDVEYTKPNLKEIQRYFDEADIIVAHNLKFDLHWIHHLGIDTSKNRYYCTMVAEYLINGQSRETELSLRVLSQKYNIPDKLDMVGDYWDSGYETDEIPLDVLIPYGEQDVLNCEAIYKSQIPIIVKQRQSKLVKLRCESLRVTQQIEANGMKINTELCQNMSQDYANKINQLTETLIETTKESLPELRDININLSSNDHLSAILFGGIIKYDGREDTQRVLKDGTIKIGSRSAKLFIRTAGIGFVPREGTETAKPGYYQTDVGQLTELKAKTPTQKLFLEFISELSKMEKMKGTYCDGLLERNIGGVVHPSINETATRTGRYSSSNPNSQNMPREGTSPVKMLFTTRY